MVKRISYSFGKYLIDSLKGGDVIYKELFQKTIDIINCFLKILLTETSFEKYQSLLNDLTNSEYSIHLSALNSVALLESSKKTESISINVTLITNQEGVVAQINISFFGKERKRELCKLCIIVYRDKITNENKSKISYLSSVPDILTSDILEHSHSPRSMIITL
ncbi:MAG: hypothetical protein WC849_01685 [Candidatus Paceibacterota bacterium]